MLKTAMVIELLKEIEGIQWKSAEEGLVQIARDAQPYRYILMASWRATAVSA